MFSSHGGHLTQPSPKRLTVLNINCRSVIEKKLELKFLTDQTRPDIIAGTESWLNDSHCSNEIFDTDYYSIFMIHCITERFVSGYKPLSQSGWSGRT